MFNKVSVNKMLDGLEGYLGEDDYSEPLNILINSLYKDKLELKFYNDKCSIKII